MSDTHWQANQQDSEQASQASQQDKEEDNTPKRKTVLGELRWYRRWTRMNFKSNGIVTLSVPPNTLKNPCYNSELFEIQTRKKIIITNYNDKLLVFSLFPIKFRKMRIMAESLVRDRFK